MEKNHLGYLLLIFNYFVQLRVGTYVLNAYTVVDFDELLETFF